MTAASTPETPSASAGRYAAKPVNSEIVISTGTSSRRRRTTATTQPTTSPIATPPNTARTNSPSAARNEKLPPMAAATATRYAISAEASLTRLSPSIRLTSRRGAPSPRAIAVAATGSVGETIAPSAKATAQGRPMSSCPSTPTTQVVTNTNPIEVSDSARASARSARRSAMKAAT